ncbi:MAG: CxxH/CxxC protein [Clostridiaceae bacterium]
MRMIYSCTEDYDMAIDDFILESKTFPVIVEDQSGICSYCKNKSAYRLELFTNHTDDLNGNEE